MVETHDLQEYRELDRSLTSTMGDNHDHQVRRFILKDGFQEPIITIISCDLKPENACITEGITIVSGWPTRKVYHSYHHHHQHCVIP